MSKIVEKPMVGGKARGLQFLQENGFLTPKFYSISYDVLNDAEALEVELSKIIKQSSSFRWAVRSSASKEDGINKSYAGQFKTVLNLEAESIKSAIYEVIESYSSIQDKYGVVLQEMVEPEISGVIFSKDPLNLISSEAILSVIPGIGSKLVNGEFEGCTLRVENELITFIEEGDFEGFHYVNNQEIEVKMSHLEIHHIIYENLTKITQGIDKLEKLLNIPVDVEFAIANGELFWLQQRPITSRNFIRPSSVWDKTASEISFPGLTLPLSCSINNRSIGLAFQKVDAAVGYSKKILKYNEVFSSQMSKEINGALYYNITSWQSLIYQLPFGIKYAKQLPKTWGMNKIPFKYPDIRHNWFQRMRIGIKLSFMLLRSKQYRNNYEASFLQILDRLERTDLNKLTASELFSLYVEIEDELTEHYFAPVSNGYFAMVAFTRLKEQLSKTNILSTHPNFANDVLMNQKDFVSVAAVDNLHLLLDEIVSDSELHALFQSHNPKEVLNSLTTDYISFLSDIKSYLSQYGNRAPNGDLKIENTPFNGDIVLFIDYLKINSVHYKKRGKRETSFDYKEILKHELKSSPLRKRKINKLINRAISRTRDRELYRYQRSQAFSISRKIFKQIGKSLVLEGYLDKLEDVAYLTVENLEELDNKSIYKGLVKEQKEAYERFQPQDLPSTFVESKGIFHPIIQQIVAIEDGEIKGVGCCSGVVTGKIIRVDKDTNLQQDFSNYILIGLYFEPGQMNMISSAKGIISERGNLLSHTAIICREMGIPSIVGAKGIMKLVEVGSQIKMNGGTGIIQML
jgi:pyruvate,water dikinase